MQGITKIGIDLAKQMFQIHGVDNLGHVVLNKQLRRHKCCCFLTN